MTRSKEPSWSWKQTWPIQARSQTGRPVTLAVGIVTSTSDGEPVDIFGIRVGRLGETVALENPTQIGLLLANIREAAENLDIDELR
ncbi:hypothetical protein [Amycolatopsis sp. YIM 10]|uniref:hypothetical protein n=1 Tax=Amycolatopsis sp. YIM 10 TaxID=2653857 RepID=UPI00129071D7|nr:hypothetical protein [Amycolatopsis sp. YIM 10]